jgi:peptidoglycan/LPS O-acetylase OafA/YrhL
LLDDLRGVAALLVVLNHLKVVSGSVGHFAVMVFFVISGYCIRPRPKAEAAAVSASDGSWRAV